MAAKKRSRFADTRDTTKGSKVYSTRRKGSYGTERPGAWVDSETHLRGGRTHGRLRIVPKSGERPVYRFTLDDLEELAGHAAAEAHHAKNRKREKELRRLAIRIAAVLGSYTDEDDESRP